MYVYIYIYIYIRIGTFELLVSSCSTQIRIENAKHATHTSDTQTYTQPPHGSAFSDDDGPRAQLKVWCPLVAIHMHQQRTNRVLEAPTFGECIALANVKPTDAEVPHLHFIIRDSSEHYSAHCGHG